LVVIVIIVERYWFLIPGLGFWVSGSLIQGYKVKDQRVNDGSLKALIISNFLSKSCLSALNLNPLLGGARGGFLFLNQQLL